ncbi:DNA-directed RNA polymerase subunit delta [Paenibacillus xylaniclasticus]|uniref:DNA-directed RNA polymerase subunit delta n=1 Tax=Paenibacillus xylaniclasticus TaxID=588083 RepID=UPI000FDC2AA5|nr:MULTISPECIES: DNA-directed RNA polymerase subunit delta [Paenibacillus]GFN34015.1 hypothetical protein PCURB6_42750 [Paenibacillus curdlanolyticus]
MSSDFAAKWDREHIQEMPMVDLAFEVLKSVNTPMYYRDLMMEIAKIRELDPDTINDVIAQVYTEINIDGRFACVGNNNWGLKRWYPVERNEDPVASSKRPRIINDDDDEDEDLYADEEEETYTPEEDDYDSYDEDHEEFEDGEEEADVDEEVALDDEELEEEEDLDAADEEEDFDGDLDESDDDN